MYDSIFSRFAQEPFPNDRPLVPASSILAAMDGIAEPLAAQLYGMLGAAIDQFIGRHFNSLQLGDRLKLLSGEWNLDKQMQLALFAAWQAAWGEGGKGLIAEIKAAVPSRLTYADGDEESILEEREAAIDALLTIQPDALTSNPAVVAIRQRTFQLAGSFASSQLERLKLDLIEAIEGAKGAPISRKELVQRIEDNLQVGKTRAIAIAQTEVTAAYNAGRVATALLSDEVTHFRFLAIDDNRTTPICRSRNGLIVPKTEYGLYVPPLHVRCRSTISPVMAGILPKHQAWVDDPARNPNNRELVPLPKNWRNGDLELPKLG